MKPLVLAGESGASRPALVIGILAVVGLALSLTGRNYTDQRAP